MSGFWLIPNFPAISAHPRQVIRVNRIKSDFENGCIQSHLRLVSAFACTLLTVNSCAAADVSIATPPSMISDPEMMMKFRGAQERYIISESSPKLTIKSLMLALGATHEQAQSLLMREPNLVCLSTMDMKRHLDILSQALSLDPQEQWTPGTSVSSPTNVSPQKQGSKNPSGHGPSNIRLHQAAANLVLKQPQLLLVSEADIKLRMKAMAAMLKAPVDSVPGLVMRQPGLLTHNPTTLSVRLKGLKQIFDADEKLMSHLILTEPGLLTFKHDEIAALFEDLSQIFGEDTSGDSLAKEACRRVPTILVMQSNLISERFTDLGGLLKLPQGAVASVAARAPQLLLLPSDIIKSNMIALAELLQVTEERAVVLCSDQPSLLTISTKVLRQRLSTLGTLLGIPSDKLYSLVSEKPILLTKSSQSVVQAISEARAKGDLPAGRK